MLDRVEAGSGAWFSRRLLHGFAWKRLTNTTKELIDGAVLEVFGLEGLFNLSPP